MKEAHVRELLKAGLLRPRGKDISRARSLVEAAEKISGVVASMRVTENSATVVFRELYECLRQLGDAKWWLLGYESLSHEASMRILMEEDIRNKVKLNHLDRFRHIRNDANYRGYLISVSNAIEMRDFWNLCGKELLGNLKRAVR
ncbi:MAG: hypothetical protein QXH27_02250 [Candidatus Micrarchaeia archaeon]